jgi:hypothetical protein
MTVVSKEREKERKMERQRERERGSHAFRKTV